MVGVVTSLGRNGLHDWLIQRATAIILLGYIIFLNGYCLFNPFISYERWQQLFLNPWMQMASVLALLSLIGHAWVGIWTVTTDYLKLLAPRLVVQLISFLILAACLVWGIRILWGI